MLKCNVKGVEKGYPLRIEAEKVEILSSEYDSGLSWHHPMNLSYNLLTVALFQ